jgi:hypothetical protein
MPKARKLVIPAQQPSRFQNLLKTYSYSILKIFIIKINFQGIAMVTLSRIGMAAPGMVLIPLLMDRLEKKGILAK